MTLYALDKRFIIKEVPITYRDRSNGSVSKVNTISDGIKVLKKIVSMYKDYKPRKFFFLFALIFFILGLAVGIPVIIEYFQIRYIYKVPSAVLATGLMILGIIIAQCGVILDTIVKHHREDYEYQLIKFEMLENLKEK